MFRRLMALFLCFTFSLTNLQYLHAQASPATGGDFSINQLPVPGTMVSVSPTLEPALIKGLTVHKDNPFLFDFIVDPGQSKLSQNDLKEESDRMIKYFFASLTIPDKDVWVNLSPYEKDRMVPQSLGVTAMGRDLLAQDYMLKQLTASLIYPQQALGKTFWAKVYSKAKQMYGTTQVPVNTFNKVWIVPQRVGIYEHGQTAFIVDGHLKVMLEEDYLSLTKHKDSVILSEAKDLNKINSIRDSSAAPQNDTHAIGSQIIRSIILPEIEKEINDGKNFATLRQIFYAQALAVWFKRSLKQALLNRVYANKATVKGIDQNNPATNEAIYQQYLRAYKKGVFNYIKEDIDPVTQETLPRKYFSGGYGNSALLAIVPAKLSSTDMAQISNDVDFAVVAAQPRDAAAVSGFASEWYTFQERRTGGHVVREESPFLQWITGGYVMSDRERRKLFTYKNTKVIPQLEDMEAIRKILATDYSKKIDIHTIDPTAQSFKSMNLQELGDAVIKIIDRVDDRLKQAIIKGYYPDKNRQSVLQLVVDLLDSENQEVKKMIYSERSDYWRAVLQEILIRAGIDAAMAIDPIKDAEILKRIDQILSEEYSQPVRRIVLEHLQGLIKPLDALLGIMKATNGHINQQAAQWLLDASYLTAAHDLTREEFKILRNNLDNIPFDLRMKYKYSHQKPELPHIRGYLYNAAPYIAGQWYGLLPMPSIPAATTYRHILDNIESYLSNLGYNETVRRAVMDYVNGQSNLSDILKKTANALGSQEAARWLLDAAWLTAKYKLNQSGLEYIRNNNAHILQSMDFVNLYGRKVLTSPVAADAHLLYLRWLLVEKSQENTREFLDLNLKLAQSHDAAMISLKELWKKSITPGHKRLGQKPDKGINPVGGIDLSQQGSALHIVKDANGGVKVDVDPALIARVEREGMSEVDPVIINMQPANLRTLFGVVETIGTH